MRYLTVRELLLIHSIVIDESGGSHGVRDHGGLEAILALPQQGAFGKELYPTLFEKAATYARGVIQNHPFVDGNKRTGITTANTFLELNGYSLRVRRGSIERFALRVANERLSLDAIARWLQVHATTLTSER